ncbi:MAG: epoxyqueuosine reductase [Deltaproteobacteria bacterium]|nr:epoxyqueuosine reductase [Deltaproteobacteria bacterium]
MRGSNAADWIRRLIEAFLDQPSENRMKAGSEERIWDPPLVGFSRGDDPLYDAFKEHVGDIHWTPREAFAQAFPGVPVSPDELAVVSWVLPQTEATKRENRDATFYPSERWARARVRGEDVNDGLRRHLVKKMTSAGISALAPVLLPEWKIGYSERYVMVSSWSERHAAYASGLGTFGLSDGLITEKGKAHRAGSVIARIETEITPRPYSDHHAYCLFFSEGTCRACIERCPAQAITEGGHDKVRCRTHTVEVCSTYVQTQFGLDGGYGCGLCQTGVPCESRIPRRRERPVV